MRRLSAIMLLMVAVSFGYKVEAISVHTGADVYKKLRDAAEGSQYVINLSDEQFSTTDSNSAHYKIMITELDAPGKVLVQDKYNVWACPYKVYQNQGENGVETSDPDRSTAWILTKIKTNNSGDGASDYYTLQSTSSWRYMPNKKLMGYSWLHTEEASYAREHVNDFLFQIEVVEEDTDPDNPNVRLYNNESGTRMYMAEDDRIAGGWGSNPIKFSTESSFGSKIRFQFPPESIQQTVIDQYDVTTGIDDVTIDADAVPECRKGIYDIYGRRVKNPVAGTFYIVDGKKVIYRE